MKRATTMKRMAICSFLTLFGIGQSVRAQSVPMLVEPAVEQANDTEQPPGAPPALRAPSKQELEDAADLGERGHKRRRNGIFLTALGGAGTVVGAVLLAIPVSCPPPQSCLASGLGREIAVLATLGLALPIAIVGATLWSRGSSEIARSRELIRPRVVAAPIVFGDGSSLAYGAGLSGRF